MRSTMKRTIVPLGCMAFLGACTTVRLAQADKAYERMAYEKAAMLYDRTLGQATDPAQVQANHEAMLRAADAHERNREMTQAAAWYERASSTSPLESEHAFRYGQVLMALNDMPAAEEQFMSVLSTDPENHVAQDLLASCRSYIAFYADTSRYVVSEVPMSGTGSAFCAVPYKDGIVVAGDQPPGIQRENPWNGQSFLDLYFVQKHTAVTWEKAVPLGGEVNGPFHEGPAVISSDGRTMYFTRSNYYTYRLQKDRDDVSHLKLFRATLNDRNEWADVREFAYNGTDFSTGHAALSADGNTLYFASDRPGGIGGSDLWRSVNNGDGWGTPENLGPTINTPGDELFPTVVGEALYFSSTAHQNMGGLDIFVSNREGTGWAEPTNMGYPINTRFDDFAFTMNSDGKSGYLSSDRTGTDRIHQFFVQEPVFMVEGLVFDETGNEFMPNTQVVLTNLQTDSDTSMITANDGKFRFRMDPNSRYRLQVSHEGMLSETREISTEGMAASKLFSEEFRMKPVEMNRSFVVENIYFDYDKWDIRPDAASELNKLVRVFNDNPQLTFELSSHTDSRGGDVYNLVLSDARANATVDYLIRAGVSPDRLVAKGYGEEVLTNKCKDGVTCSEEEHQANRRTEFKVVKVKELASQDR